MVKAVEHGLKVVAEEFKKIHEPKISKLKGEYSANTTLIFNGWLKDIDKCVCNHNLSEHEAVQLVKDSTIKHTHEAVEFYLDTNEKWSYSEIKDHLRTLFESGKTFSSFLSNFYGQHQKSKETED